MAREAPCSGGSGGMGKRLREQAFRYHSGQPASIPSGNNAPCLNLTFFAEPLSDRFTKWLDDDGIRCHLISNRFTNWPSTPLLIPETCNGQGQSLARQWLQRPDDQLALHAQEHAGSDRHGSPVPPLNQKTGADPGFHFSVLLISAARSPPSLAARKATSVGSSM
jgi:hypothetical protein